MNEYWDGEEAWDGLNEEEKIRMENDLLRMKIMLEHGGTFDEETPIENPEIENEFLKGILAFEKQMNSPEKKQISVYDKLDKPGQFIPAGQLLPGTEKEALDELLQFMAERGIMLEVLSPNVEDLEVYRFVLEELFDYKIDDLDIPGLMQCFVYDEFHPDPLYEASHTLENGFFNALFDKQADADGQQAASHIADGFEWNGVLMDREMLTNKVLTFQQKWEVIEFGQMTVDASTVGEEQVWLQGSVEAVFSFADVPVPYHSRFKAVIQKRENGFFVSSLQMQDL